MKLLFCLILTLFLELSPSGFEYHALNTLKLLPLAIIVDVNPCPVQFLNLSENLELIRHVSFHYLLNDFVIRFLNLLLTIKQILIVITVIVLNVFVPSNVSLSGTVAIVFIGKCYDWDEENWTIHHMHLVSYLHDPCHH